MQTLNNLPYYHLRIATSKVFDPKDIRDAFIYTESSVHLDHNAYIHLHIKELDALCQEHGEEFIYIPRLYQNLLRSSDTAYYDPTGVNVGQHLVNPLSLSYLNNILSTNGYIQQNKDYDEPDFFNAESILLHQDEDNGYSSNFLGYDLTSQSPECILDLLRSYYIERDGYAEAEEEDNSTEPRLTRHCGTRKLSANEHIFRSTTEDILPNTDIPPYDADERFDEESRQLLREVREKLDALRMKGFDNLLLSKVLIQPQRLSPIYVTKDYHILLQDYNKEVQMKPLPKTVYFLFMLHPEGIRFKELANYREELLHIYLRISHRTSDEKICKSIDDLCDPTNNSINEKCARIREAFLSVVDDSIARNYYITGARGEAKGILLAREMRITTDAQFGLSVYDVFNSAIIYAIGKWINKFYYDTKETNSNIILKELQSLLRRINNKHLANMKLRYLQLPVGTTSALPGMLDQLTLDNKEGVQDLITTIGNSTERDFWECYNFICEHPSLIKEYIQSRDWQQQNEEK